MRIRCPRPRLVRPRRELEHIEQVALFQWLAWTPAPPPCAAGLTLDAYIIAIPNGGARSKAQAGKLKAEGVKAGVSDVLVAIPMGARHGLWLEMKAPRPHAAAVSKQQKTWLSRMSAMGYACGVARGYEEAKALICDYLEVEQ